MRVLILRTFAHSKVWDDRNSCEYEAFQRQLIEQWDPGYQEFNRDNFVYGIGLYIHKYFTHKQLYGGKESAFKGTDEEQIPSVLRLRGDESGSIVMERGLGSFWIEYELDRKLWKKPDRALMTKLDDALIRCKRQEITYKGIEVNVNPRYNGKSGQLRTPIPESFGQ